MHQARAETQIESRDVPGTASVEQGIETAAPVGMAIVPPYPTIERLGSGSGDPLGGSDADPEVGAALRRSSGGGRPLDRVDAHRFGQGFGADLSAVRLHTDAQADGLARSVQATAFTYGSDIYFSHGSFSPSTPAGDHLLAHELAHVVQRTAGASNSPGPLGGSGIRIGRADDPAEVAADAAADAVMPRLRGGGASGHAPVGVDPVRQPLARTVRRSATGRGGVGTAPGVIRRDDTVVDETAPTPEKAGAWVGSTDARGARSGLTVGGARQRPAAPKWASGQSPMGPRMHGLTTERDPVKRLRALVESAEAPKNNEEAADRLKELRQLLTLAGAAGRKTISEDTALMTRARTFVGDFEYMALVAAVGMYVAPGPERAKQPDAAAHMSGAEADEFIRQNMGSISHLKGYIDTAVGAGKKADGYIAVVGDEDWKRIYEKQYKGRTAGKDDTFTNAFIANTHADRPAVIHHDRGTRSTAIHESMHRYSELGVLHTYGSPLNEGITEYFTRLITDKDGKPVHGGKSNRSNYQKNWTFVQALLGVLGDGLVEQQTALAEAYFSGKVGILRTKFVAACVKHGQTEAAGASAWDDVMDNVGQQKWGSVPDMAALAQPPAPKAAPAAPAPPATASATPSAATAPPAATPAG